MIELMLVIVTIGIVAAMAAPRYARALSNYRARTAAQRVAADLAAAAAEACASSSTRAVRFDVAAGTYRVGAAGEVVRLAAEPYGAALVSANFGGDDAVVFDGYGAPDSGGTVVVRSGDFTRTVTLDAATGRATVQ
jgi:Tfp pilus assembly protein FimT